MMVNSRAPILCRRTADLSASGTVLLTTGGGTSFSSLCEHGGDLTHRNPCTGLYLAVDRMEMNFLADVTEFTIFMHQRWIGAGQRDAVYTFRLDAAAAHGSAQSNCGRHTCPPQPRDCFKRCALDSMYEYLHPARPGCEPF